jgi:TRAP-type mannitol/chloroaromatic compound transport system substrate-binding protein
MERRRFLGFAPLAVAACATETNPTNVANTSASFRWRMVTSWPPNFPGHGVSAARLARRFSELSGGRLQVEVFAAGELVPALEVLDAVSSGAIEMGHTGPIYWRGKIPAAQIFGSIPFGMQADEFNAWIYHGGGMDLWREAYEPINVIPFLAGNTGPQMGGWFNREINSLGDLDGLKMRIPGLGGDVMNRAGVLPVTLPAGEIFTALQTGTIDAAEWVGPYNDLAFGLYQAARYYYYPGWQEPSGALECIISREAYEQLPEDLKFIVQTACIAEADYVLAEFNARNFQALNALINDHGVELKAFPEDVLQTLKAQSSIIMNEMSNQDPLVEKIYSSYMAFANGLDAWMKISGDAHSLY